MVLIFFYIICIKHFCHPYFLLQSQLEATRQERDIAVSKVRKLQEDLDEVKVFYRYDITI